MIRARPACQWHRVRPPGRPENEAVAPRRRPAVSSRAAAMAGPWNWPTRNPCRSCGVESVRSLARSEATWGLKSALLSAPAASGREISGLTLLAVVLDAHDLGVEIVPPGGAEFDQVQATVRTELHVHRPFECHVVAEPFHLCDMIVPVEVDGDDPVSRPFVDEQRVMEISGQLVLRFETRIEIINRTGHRDSGSDRLHPARPRPNTGNRSFGRSRCGTDCGSPSHKSPDAFPGCPGETGFLSELYTFRPAPGGCD